MRTNISPLLTTNGPQSLTVPHFPANRSESGHHRFETEASLPTSRKKFDATNYVAALSTERILEMTRTELIDVIRSVRASHLRPGVVERLPQMDGDTLRRLVFLTRRYCRHQQLLAENAGSPSIFAAYCR
ncbi:MAG: hypothetical protein M3552_08900 [Planctomycetota bacterium]|nr:hypothetical protein [Planctomycetota bacterium]